LYSYDLVCRCCIILFFHFHLQSFLTHKNLQTFKTVIYDIGDGGMPMSK